MRSPYGGFTATSPLFDCAAGSFASSQRWNMIRFARPARAALASASRIATGSRSKPRMRPGVSKSGWRRDSASARSLFQAAPSCCFQRSKPNRSRSRPGAMSAAISRRLDRKRAGPAHRVDESTAGRRNRRPAGANENRGCQVLLERGRALCSAVAAPMQAVARQVDRDRDGAAGRMHIDAKRWRIAVDGGPRPRPLAKLVDDRVLDSLRAELRMRHAGNAAGEVDGERAVGVHVRAPVSLADSCVKRVGVRNRKPCDLPKHAKAQARLEAGAVCARELRFASDPAQHFAHAFDVECGQL